MAPGGSITGAHNVLIVVLRQRRSAISGLDANVEGRPRLQKMLRAGAFMDTQLEIFAGHRMLLWRLSPFD